MSATHSWLMPLALEAPLHQVRGRLAILVALGRHAPAPTATDAAQAAQPHQPGDAIAPGHHALLAEFGVDAWHAIGGIADLVGLANTLHNLSIGQRPGTGRTLQPVVVAAVRHAQRLAQGAHGEVGLVRLHESVDGACVFSLLPANQAVAFANMSRSICTCLSLRRSSNNSWRSLVVNGVPAGTAAPLAAFSGSAALTQ